MALIPESPEARSAKLAQDLLRSLARSKSDLVANEGLRKQPSNSPECWEGKWTNRRVIDELIQVLVAKTRGQMTLARIPVDSVRGQPGWCRDDQRG